MLIIFAKEPVPGQVKTRLCPPLSPEAAADLYHCFLFDILQEMSRQVQVSLALAYDPPGALPFFRQIAPPGCLIIPQEGPDLGERLARAFNWGFRQGFTRILIRNSDSPDLPARLIEEAREELGKAGRDVILGPSPDGGYYLIGLKRPQPQLFEGLTWSSSRTLAETLNRAARLNLKVHLLPAWPDIDTFADLAAFAQREPASPTPGRPSRNLARKLIGS